MSAAVQTTQENKKVFPSYLWNKKSEHLKYGKGFCLLSYMLFKMNFVQCLYPNNQAYQIT